MSIYNIVTKEDKLLRKVCKPVPEITPNVKKLLDNMLETMYESNGVGLGCAAGRHFETGCGCGHRQKKVPDH